MKLFSAATLICTLFFTFSANAQSKKDSLSIVKKDTISNKNTYFEKGKEYLLGGINVTGLKKFSEETVRVFTGLRNGQAIKLPGDKLTSAIKKLYESKQFSNVDVYLEKLDKNTVYLRFHVQELPQLNTVKITGIKKGKAKELLKEAELKQGAMVTDNLIVTSRNYFTKKYTDKGFLKTKVNLDVKKDTTDANTVNMAIFIDKGEKIKIKNIFFKGNKAISGGKLRKAMKNTKKKFLGRFWKGSKYIEEDYLEDLESVLDKYSRLGYRDARILSDKITWNDNNTINIHLELEEGRQYRFAEILFVGNKEYTDEQLQMYLKIEKGEIYNGAVLKERIKGDGSPTSQDISTLYQDNGFLFSTLIAFQKNV
jgi:outer membrane protein insertion porin family